VDRSNERISIGLKQSYFPEAETPLKPVSERDGMETAIDQEADVTSDDDGEEFQEDDDEDVKNTVEFQGAPSDDGK